MAFNDPFNPNSVTLDDDETNNFYNFNGEDPAAEFLAREKRELGDIAGNNIGDSFDDPFNTRATNYDLEIDDDRSSFMNAKRDVSPLPSNPSPYAALSQLNEPEKIRKWREEFAERIKNKDTEEEIKRKEMREQAKKELDDFYKKRLEQLERTKGQNRSNNRSAEDNILNDRYNATTSNGKISDWEKITSLCEFNPKNNRSQKDLTRYRSVLLQLKQQSLTSGK